MEVSCWRFWLLRRQPILAALWKDTFWKHLLCLPLLPDEAISAFMAFIICLADADTLAVVETWCHRWLLSAVEVLIDEFGRCDCCKMSYFIPEILGLGHDSPLIVELEK
jgi:hypothetical protein